MSKWKWVHGNGRTFSQIIRDVATITRITPMQRDLKLMQYCKRVNDEPKTRQLLADWGLRLMDQGVELDVRQLNEERVVFANGKSFGVGPNADFGEYSTKNELMAVVPLTNWLVIHTKSDQKAVRSFIEYMERNASPMGIAFKRPKIIILENDRNESWAQTLRQALSVETQIVVCICPTNRDDRYNIIKKICCAELPIPSQVQIFTLFLRYSKNSKTIVATWPFFSGDQCPNIVQWIQSTFNHSENCIANELQNGRLIVVHENSIEECHDYWHWFICWQKIQICFGVCGINEWYVHAMVQQSCHSESQRRTGTWIIGFISICIGCIPEFQRKIATENHHLPVSEWKLNWKYFHTKNTTYSLIFIAETVLEMAN